MGHASGPGPGHTPRVGSPNNIIGHRPDPIPSAGDRSKTFEVLAEMRAAGVPPTTAGAFNVLIEACGRAGDLSKAFEVLVAMEAAGVQPTAGTFNLLTEACGQAPGTSARRSRSVPR